MKLVIQRVSKASVRINGKVHAEINKGLLLFLGIEEKDDTNDADYLASKCVNMRLFEDEEKKMNLSLVDISGELLIISQFTLHAATKKGNRPSFIKAAKPAIAEPLYTYFINRIHPLVSKEVKSGVFGAFMQIELINDGPVTIIMDSKNRE
jgi:D-tyrosyl-tRNA(Tyr) deacylase